jgi:undecaprenyl pyrophosphate synthase
VQGNPNQTPPESHNVETSTSRLPVHVAIVMDGNGRWANAIVHAVSAIAPDKKQPGTISPPAPRHRVH